GNIGSAYATLGQVEKAIEYYEQALVICKAIKDPRIINFCEGKLELVKHSDITATGSRWKKLSKFLKGRG
ncbi:MAG: tetratricopeptide repeat protein, partial [Methanosarcinales archaeon]